MHEQTIKLCLNNTNKTVQFTFFASMFVVVIQLVGPGLQWAVRTNYIIINIVVVVVVVNFIL